MKFDTAINLAYDKANSWTDKAGNIILGTAEGTIYACGDAMKIYAKSDVVTEVPQVALVGKDHEYGKGFSIFAHVNIANADEYGVIYVNGPLHSEKPEFKMEDVISETNRAQIMKTTATDIGKVDFMTTLTYRADSPNPTRWARAYVKVGDNYYYSHVVGNQ